MKLDRDGVIKLVNAAYDKGGFPDLNGINLRDADLRYVDLYGANLRYANLRGADLRGADLRGAELCGANLRGAELRGADLCGANLCGANLRGAEWGGLQITDLPSGQLTLTPTCDGWQLRVGCWSGTPDQLRELVAHDKGWPEAKGEEITRRRPYLQAALALCEVHMKDHQDVIEELKARWGND